MPFPHYLGHAELGRLDDRLAGPVLNRAVRRLNWCLPQSHWLGCNRRFVGLRFRLMHQLGVRRHSAE
jgi:hypothetical protein